MVLASYSALSHGITSNGLALKMPNVRDRGQHSTQPPLVLSMPWSLWWWCCRCWALPGQAWGCTGHQLPGWSQDLDLAFALARIFHLQGICGLQGQGQSQPGLATPRAHICTARWLQAQQAGGQDKAAISRVIKHTENYYLKELPLMYFYLLEFSKFWIAINSH